MLPELRTKASSPAKTDDDVRALRSATASYKMTRGQLGRLRGEYWIGVLEDEGVLPNYTLLDETVTLDVGLSWVDPDSGEFDSDHAQITRGSAQAIREFAPGATFYARGYEIAIDALDLGMEGESIRPWVFCPACGYAHDAEAAGVEVGLTSCPRCGSTGIADTGQRIDVVALTHVSAEVRRDEAMITDRSDQRDSAQFQVFTAVDVDRGAVVRQWFVGGSGFGVTYLRSVDIRWINAGLPGRGGARMIGGDERSASLFRVCAGCGKLDTAPGKNMPHEHRPWCRFRTATEENTRQVALSRTLTTQGLMLRLPPAVTLGDSFAVPSLGAAVLLGLREQHGGHPDHLQVASAVDPTLSDGSDNAEGLLLHDVVPGGTGYLAELAEPAALRELLVLAYRTVRDCECRHERRLACHRCLLPFVRGATDSVSRAAAERHLRAVLGLPADADDDALDGMGTWAITEEPPTVNPESHLEQRFRAKLAERLDALGAAVKEEPGVWGNTLRFTVPGAPRQWTLRPQVDLVGCRPDFVLETQDTSVPQMAIFTDGRAFHATVKHNRLADDAEKRSVLRDTGRVVLGISSKDLDVPEHDGAPSWWSDAVVKQVIAQPQLQASPAAYARLRRGPVDLVMEWIDDPSTRDRSTVADALPAFFMRSSSPVSVSEDVTPTGVAAAVLRGDPPPEGGRRVAVWRSGALALVMEPRAGGIEVALVLDDRDEVLDDAHADAWREWLRLSNHLALRSWPTTITTLTSIAGAVSTTPAPADRPAGAVTEDETLPDDASAPWLAAHADADSPAERALLAALARVEGVDAPVVGGEGPDGIPVELAWPARRLAVELTPLPEQDRADLTDHGWVVVPGDVEAIIAVLRSATDTEVTA